MTEENTPAVEADQEKVPFWSRPIVRKVSVLIGAIAGVSIATLVLNKNSDPDWDIEVAEDGTILATDKHGTTTITPPAPVED